MRIGRFGHLEADKAMESFAVVGAGSGCGCTHYAVSWANYLHGTTGASTAIVQACSGNAFENICEMCEVDELEENHFKYYGVEYYMNVSDEKMIRIFNHGYRYVLIDCGAYCDAVKNRMMMTSHKMIVGSLMPWRCVEYKEFCDANAEYLGKSGWHYYMRDGEKGDADYFSRTYGIRIKKIPSVSNPYRIRKEDMVFFEKERRCL